MTPGVARLNRSSILTSDGERRTGTTHDVVANSWQRLFAKPFLGQMGKGHVDGVYSMAKDPNSLKHFASGSGDGIIKVSRFQSSPVLCSGRRLWVLISN